MSDPASAPPAPSRAELWLKDRRRGVLAVLVGAALLLRIAAWVELRDTPCVHAAEWTQTDMHFFDEWARAIARGDWLSNAEYHPVMEWQKECARQLFAEQPEQRRLYSGTDEQAARGLWNRWSGGKQFHQEPLYVYLVAITYKIFGHEPRAVFLWQAALGVLSTVLVYLLARRLFGDLAGAIAGLLSVFYAPLMLNELALLRTSLTTFIGLALALGVDQALERGTLRAWFLAGLGFGVALLCQTTFGAFILGAAVLLVLKHRQDRRLLLRLGGVTAAGILLGISPLVVRNVSVGSPALGWASVGPFTFLMNNEASDDPDIGTQTMTPAQVRIMSRTEGRMSAIVAESLKSHPSGGWTWLLARKFAKFWHGYEEPDNQNLYYARKWSSTLNCSVPFAWISPLAIVGLALAAKDPKRSALLMAYILAGVAISVLAFPVSRYRVPFVEAMLPFAALTVVRALEWASARRWKPLAIATVSLVALGFWVARPLPAIHPLIYPAEYVAPYGYFWYPRMQAATSPGEALLVMERSLRVEPPELSQLAKRPPRVSTYQVELAGLYAGIYRTYADLLAATGRKEDAERATLFSKLLTAVSTLRP